MIYLYGIIGLFILLGLYYTSLSIIHGFAKPPHKVRPQLLAMRASLARPRCTRSIPLSSPLFILITTDSPSKQRLDALHRQLRHDPDDHTLHDGKNKMFIEIRIPEDLQSLLDQPSLLLFVLRQVDLPKRRGDERQDGGCAVGSACF